MWLDVREGRGKLPCSPATPVNPGQSLRFRNLDKIMELLWPPQHMGLQNVASLGLVEPSYFGGGGAYYRAPAVVKEWDVGVEELPRKGVDLGFEA